jgi:hypothetical protein
MPLRRRPFDREIEFAIRGIYRGLERSKGCLELAAELALAHFWQPARLDAGET